MPRTACPARRGPCRAVRDVAVALRRRRAGCYVDPATRRLARDRVRTGWSLTDLLAESAAGTTR